MIDAYALLFKLYQQPKLPELDESLIRALNLPKPIVVASLPGPKRALEERLISVEPPKEKYTGAQMHVILDRPFLDARLFPLDEVYVDLRAKGDVIVHMLESYPPELLKKSQVLMPVLDVYTANVREFVKYLRAQLNEVERNRSICLERFLEPPPATALTEEEFERFKAKLKQGIKEAYRCREIEEKAARDLTLKLDEIDDIMALIKDLGLKKGLWDRSHLFKNLDSK